MTARRRRHIGSHLLLIAFSALMLYPVVWWIGASLKTTAELGSPSLFPAVPQWSNFTEGWFAIPKFSFTHFYLNTFKLILGVLLTTLVSTSLVAYAFARLDFPLRNFWFAIVLVTLMLPSQVTLVPQYVLFHTFGWVNTYWPFYMPHALAGGIGGSFFIYLLVQFIRGIPRELDESAKMDGCTQFGIYWRIVLPLTKPALVTVFIYCFLWNWDDFFGQMIYINSVDKYTVQLALRMFIDTQSASAWGQLLAMSLVSIVPAVVVFLSAQRYFVEGIATTGIKG
ncbi:Binding-protein-dependent transport systems inner membrane component, ABC transporter, permease protein [Thermobacillus xylanilyticus]|jgi:multiple sugar transport system permease protein|uniref:Binding-protein-dependent transport systems inner membrane component, ABC transporter, permease protein n=1 Tax=Thermobacillus xylanilyticus TaxID=76633 RepID=A0ABN7RL14_THEXY|nr:carbohydrate ABC transporter permease [Thermobacillus xylanilyticus]REJ11323.1 MAG: ABC transporter permease [Paenibacillaceae bacterium]CAG5077228.1 Binding-protein-dependent transport systems inner membrane component, ABC transporter, permease protein [Thermobacillus xylanilyticus]